MTVPSATRAPSLFDAHGARADFLSRALCRLRNDVVEDGGGPRHQIAATVFGSYAPQLDLSFAAAVYGLAGLFLGALMGELLVAVLFPQHRFAR